MAKIEVSYCRLDPAIGIEALCATQQQVNWAYAFLVHGLLYVSDHGEKWMVKTKTIGARRGCLRSGATHNRASGRSKLCGLVRPGAPVRETVGNVRGLSFSEISDSDIPVV
jgi:hypothetical protein